MTIARTILAQLGGNRFVAMTGAKHMLDTGRGLRLKIARRIVSIELDADDTYTVTTTRFDCSPVASATGVYADQLRRTFTQQTGLLVEL